MKKLNEKKGFTLVELLVAIVILGIIMAIAIPQINNLRDANKETKYKTYADSLLASGKLYTDAYKEDLFGNSSSGCVEIPYSDLKDKNLAKDIKIDETTCAVNDTYVRVWKTNDHYKYEVSIRCVKDGTDVYSDLLESSSCGTGPDFTAPTITFAPNGTDGEWVSDDDFADTTKIIVQDPYGLFENVTIKYAWTINSSGAASESSFKTHEFRNERYTSSVELDVEVPQSSTGKYYLVVKPVFVKDANGNTKSDKTVSEAFMFDNLAPSCSGNDDNTIWTRENVTVTVNCSDDGSGCVNAAVSKTYKTGTVKTSSVSIADKAGNSRNCSVNVYLDKTAPTKPTVYFRKWRNNSDDGKPYSIDEEGLNEYELDTWSNLYVFTEARDSTDTNGSGGIYYQYTTTGATSNAENTTATTRSVAANGTSYIKYRACDAVGNCSAYTDKYKIKVDTTPPTAPSVYLRKWSDNSTTPTSIDGLAEYAANTWTKYNIYTKAYNSTDTGGSGGVYYQYTTTGATTHATNTTATTRSVKASGTSYIQYRACDAAGNCSAYTENYTIKLDKSAPSIPSVYLRKWSSNSTTPTSIDGLTEYSNNTWTNMNIYTKAYNSTDTGGSGGVYYQYTTTGATTHATNTTATTRSIQAEGTSYIKYRACDAVGNCSSYTDNYTIKVDKTSPVLSTYSLNNLVLEQYDRDMNLLDANQHLYYIKSKSCTEANCGAVICLADVRGAFNVKQYNIEFTDEISSVTYSYIQKTMYGKNGEPTSTGSCLQYNDDPPCTWAFTHTAYDAAGNSASFTVNYKIGYVDGGDGLNCNSSGT